MDVLPEADRRHHLGLDTAPAQGFVARERSPVGQRRFLTLDT